MWSVILITLVIAAVVITKTFIIVQAREEVIQERLGKYLKTLKPGFHFLIPFIDSDSYHVEMREQVLDVPSQSCITKDNVQVEVDGIVYLKVMDSYKASYGIENYRRAAVNLAQTTMRSEIGKIELDNTFSERDAINKNIVREIDTASDPWGVKVLRYEIKNITPSIGIIDTLEKQMEAERTKRADITYSTGERTALINKSQGDKQAAINISEGEKQKRINIAYGKAKQISLLADATARAIERVSGAISQSNGNLAVKSQLIEQFTEEFGNIIERTGVTVLPSDLANFKGLLDTLKMPLKGA